jgi:hypothetical protein
VKVIDGFLPPAALVSLREGLLAPGFPWRCVPVLSGDAAQGLAPSDSRQWVHGFGHRRTGVSCCSPALWMFKPVAECL